MRRALVIEDGTEYQSFALALLADTLIIDRAGDGEEALRKAANADCFLVDLRFDRLEPAALIGDLARIATDDLPEEKLAPSPESSSLAQRRTYQGLDIRSACTTWPNSSNASTTRHSIERLTVTSAPWRNGCSGRPRLQPRARCSCATTSSAFGYGAPNRNRRFNSTIHSGLSVVWRSIRWFHCASLLARSMLCHAVMSSYSSDVEIPIRTLVAAFYFGAIAIVGCGAFAMSRMRHAPPARGALHPLPRSGAGAIAREHADRRGCPLGQPASTDQAPDPHPRRHTEAAGPQHRRLQG